MKIFLEYFIWILFAVLWIWLWWWIVTERSIYSQVTDDPDQWWYQRIGIPDTSYHNKFYDSIDSVIENDKDSFN